MAVVHRVASVSAWFRVPEFMDKFEILSRGTAFAVEQQEQQQLALLTSSHIVAPWRWPQYYPQDWVRQVTNDHTRYTLELRELPHWNVIAQFELDSALFLHDTRDVAALRFQDQAEALTGMAAIDVRLATTKFSAEPLGSEDSVVVIGHAILPESDDDNPFRDPDADDCREQEQQEVVGQLHLRTANQAFLRTAHVLGDGMCGGPVLDSGDLTRAYGIIEGIVPADGAHGDLNGCAAFIESSQLVPWLENFT